MLPRHVWLPLLSVLLAGCTLTPEGTKSEREALSQAGTPYEPRVEERVLPELPARPTWKEVLRRAFLANGDLEASYFAWKAALERVDVAGAWPNSDLAVGYSYAFSEERMKAFDRSTFTFAPDAALNLTLPVKAKQAARVALDEARGAGERFRAAKFDLQKHVLFAWSEYTLRGRAMRLKRQEIGILRVAAGTARAGIAGGGKQESLIAAQLALSRAESELADLEAEQATQQAMLNSMLGREPHEALEPPEVPPAPREVPAEDATLLRASAATFPEVGVIAQELEASRDALELARMRWIPDISPVVGFTGTVAQFIGATVTLPTTIEQIKGRIREGEAQVRGAEAKLRQRTVDRLGEYVGLLIELRRAQARAALFRGEIMGAAESLAAVRRREYEAGSGGLADMLEAQRMKLEVELMVATSESQIEKAIVDIECCLGRDIETLEQGVHHE